MHIACLPVFATCLEVPQDLSLQDLQLLATDKLNQQCSKEHFANTICGSLTMLVYYIVDLA